MYLERRHVNPITADRICTVYVRLPCANIFRNVLGSLTVPFCIVNRGQLHSAVSCDAVGPPWIAVTCGNFVVPSLHFMFARACAMLAHMTHTALMIH